MGYGIQYKCKDGTDYYCTSKYGGFSEDIERVAEYTQQTTAEKVAKDITKSSDMTEALGEGRLFVFQIVKVPLIVQEVPLVKLQSGYRIFSEERNKYYNGKKKASYWGYNIYDDLHCSTVFKSEKEAQKTIDLITEDYRKYAYQYEPGHKQYERHIASYEPHYIEATKLKIVFIE